MEQPTEYPLILKTKEATKLLRCGRQTLYDLAEKGIIPGMYYGKGWKFNRDIILAIVASGGIASLQADEKPKKAAG
jgi:excisionase family DNA binding protein